jgi:predicted nucleic acid-binding protein
MRIDRRMPATQCGAVCGCAMAANALIDTGAMLALLDRSDRWHQLCVDTFRQLRLPLATSEAVLTELFHLVGDRRHEVEAAWRLVRSGAIVLASIENSELLALQTLMSRYADCPMDFADATLVYLAKREELSTIFTVDHGDFETYRIHGRRRFRVLPTSRPGRH